MSTAILRSKLATASVPLLEVATFVRGISFKPDDVVSFGSSGTVACFRTKNIQTSLDTADTWAVPESLVKRADQFLREGDLLVSTANSWNLVGKCCYVPDLGYQATLGGFISALRPDTARVDPRYLYYWFTSPKTQADVRNCGRQTTNISNLDTGRCLALTLPLPSRSEQRRIATILDQADTVRRKRSQANARLDELTSAIFSSMFEDLSTLERAWRRCSLEQLCESPDDIRCGPFGTQLSKDEYRPFGVPLWGIKQVNAQFATGTTEFLAQDKADKLKAYSLQSGDIVMTRKGTVGNCAIYPASLPKGIMHSDLLRVRVASSLCNPVFLSHQLHFCREVQRQIAVISGGAIMPGINVTKLKKVEVFVPPLEMQNEFARKVWDVLALTGKSQSSLNTLDALFSSLQAMAFQGKL
jgi:type I restriction enzyme S subunit